MMHRLNMGGVKRELILHMEMFCLANRLGGILKESASAFGTVASANTLLNNSAVSRMSNGERKVACNCVRLNNIKCSNSRKTKSQDECADIRWMGVPYFRGQYLTWQCTTAAHTQLHPVMYPSEDLVPPSASSAHIAPFFLYSNNVFSYLKGIPNWSEH